MSLLSRAKLSARIRRFLLQTITTIQQSNIYSTRNTHNITETLELTNPNPQRYSESSSSISDKIRTQTGEQIARPKPREIPYQAKVANRVNLIGHVKTPVHFEATSDGNHFAATVISQEIHGGKESLLIPAVFKGDLAHLVAYHVKENNCVLISGQLSTDPIRFELSDFPKNFHIVAENLNFVQGYRRNFSEKKSRVSFPGVKINKRGDERIEDEIKIGDDDDFNRQWKEAIELAKDKRWKSSGVSPQLTRDEQIPEKID